MKTNKTDAKGSRYASRKTDGWSLACYQTRHEGSNQKQQCGGKRRGVNGLVPCECPCHDITEYIVPN